MMGSNFVTQSLLTRKETNIYPQYEEENTRFNNYVVNESGFYILNKISILHLYPQHDLNF